MGGEGDAGRGHPDHRTMTPASIVRAYLVIAGLFTLSASVIWRG
jgi:hypothetical protein